MKLDGLNPPQREAVTHGDGPLQILAGAGSGKTRVITHRLALLVERGVAPWRILAVTFTNKAAGEMRERAAHLLDDERAKKMWVGTFHSTCAKLLRIHAAQAGLRPDFQIYDDDDQKKLVGRVMKDLNLSEKVMSPRAMLSRIDQAKNEGITADDFAPDSYQEELVAKVYVEFQKRLRAANAVDFGDLLVETVRLFDHPEAKKALALRFSHVLVDEFQDTNRVQYRIVQKLVKKVSEAGLDIPPNLCVVGDDDQSIYRWRGADVRNILDFEKDYPGCHVVKLEQNYRSTEVILGAANGVISRNVNRKQKRLFTEIAGGEPLVYFTGFDERREAEFIVRAIKQLVAAEGRVPGDFAILYRMHAQSRAIEEALRSVNLPYKVFGGVRFFDRVEVKDLLAYLRLLANPGDEVSLDRIVNVPPRGIGDTTLDRVQLHALKARISSWEAMRHAAGMAGDATGNGAPVRAPRRSSQAQASTENGAQFGLFAEAELLPAVPPSVPVVNEDVLGAGPRKKLAAFVELIETLRERMKEGAGLSELATATLDSSGLLERLQLEGTPEAQERIVNLEELLNSIRDYEREAEVPTLVEYLERVSLQSAADGAGGGVALMTVHAAKGLEFPVVFLAGFEEGLFPMLQPGDGLEKLEEERRLAYVAITRARERLVFTNAARRRLFREQRLTFETAPLDPMDPSSNRESRFINDVPAELIARPVAARSASPASFARAERRSDGTVVEREPMSTSMIDHDEVARTPTPISATRKGDGGARYIEYDEGAESSGDFRVGQRVKHEKFGEGRVRHLTGSGSGLKLVVDFARIGEKTIVAKFVEPVG